MDAQNSLSETSEHSFPLDLFVERTFIKQEDLEQILSKVSSKFGVRVCYNEKRQIPKLAGLAFTINDDKDKCQIAHQIFRSIEESQKLKAFDVILMIPEGIVSYIIGAKGAQINQLMQESKTNIVVNQPIDKFPLRTVKITGSSDQIAEGIRVLVEKIAQKGISDEDYNNIPQPLDPTKINSTVQIAYTANVIEYLYKNRDQYEDRNDVHMKLKDHNIKLLKEIDRVIQISGKLRNVQNALKYMIRKVNEHFSKDKLLIKIVMPGSYASKLIGSKGCLIRELAVRAGGANIKVVSDRSDTSQDSKCLVQVEGSTQNTQDACLMILEQIEQFRNGGPILQSGQYLNDNFASQYKNSIEHRHQRSSSSRRSRSRSPRRREPTVQTTLTVPTKVINAMDKNKKLKEIKNAQITDNRNGLESYVRLEGTVDECLEVIETILKEQSKTSRK